MTAHGQIQPARNERPPQALGRNENGRLGDNPPRAALGTVPGTTVAAPIQTIPPTAQKNPPLDPAAGQQRRQGAGPASAAALPSTQPPRAQRPGQPPATTGAALPSPRDLNRGAEQRRAPAGRENRGTPQATPREHAAPPAAARKQAPPPIARRARPQAPAARAPAPQTPAVARAPTPPRQAPAARAQVPQARAAPSTIGAAPRGGGGPHAERK